MVHEVRRVTLTERELALALEAYDRITPNFLPQGTITQCKVENGSQILVSLDIPSGSNTSAIDIRLYKNDLLKPLIRFCLENNIMLPRDGRKEALIEQHTVVLLITLDLEIELPESVDPMRISHLKLINAATA